MGSGAARKSRGSIAMSFTLTVISIFIIAQGSLWLGFLFSQKDIHSGNLRSKASEVASLVAEVSSRSIQQGRTSDLNFYLQKAARGKDIINIKVLDHRGRPIAHAAGPAEVSNKWNNPFFIKWKNSLEAPVLIHDRQEGLVVLDYSGKAVNDDMLNLLIVPPLWQFVVFFIIVLVIFFFTNKKLGRPIEILKERMDKVTSGDLTVDIPDTGGREIGEISDGLAFLVKGMSGNVRRLLQVTLSITEAVSGLNRMFKTATERIRKQSVSTNHIAGTMRLADESQGKIRDNAAGLLEHISNNLASVLEIKSMEEEILGNMEKLLSSVDDSYSVVAEMSRTSRVMMELASKVLGSVESASASIEEITASVREVESSARESSRMADDVRKLAARKGVATVDRAIKGMKMISEKVNTAVLIVRRLDMRSNDVRKILTFIKSITEKTNLLSINASILAEQAGEHGKGFAVVAEEMRSLSTGTEGYRKEIAGIIKEIQAEIADVVSAIELGNEMVSEGSGFVYEVGETMSSILESSHTSANMTKMIERATEDQVLALRHMERSVVEVNNMALEMDRAMGEMYKSSGFLLDRMGEVKDVAEIAMKGSGDLAKGVGSITENLENSAEGVRGIEEAISFQKHRGADILTNVESIRNEGLRIMNDLDGLSYSMERLRGEFAALKVEMDSFRVA